MSKALVEQLAEFTADTGYNSLPPEVAHESKRLLLDSIGCSLGGVGQPKGDNGIAYGRILGGEGGNARIHGTQHRTSIAGAGYANAETMNALDFDAVLPPGHVSPYVIPGAVAVAEARGASGSALLAANAIAHEMSFRFGRAMDSTRAFKDGVVTTPPVLGYAMTVFGAAAAVAKLEELPPGVIANAVAIAGHISPVNSHRAWMMQAPSTTIKYTMAGPLVQAALAAAYSAKFGHRGNLALLDDADFGYRVFIGTDRWEPEQIVADLGQWTFVGQSSYKPYPHCRILHAPLDALTDLLTQKGLAPDDIDAIRVWGEGWVMQPVWTNDQVDHVIDAQFSMTHGIAVGAHLLPPGRAWQEPSVVFSPSVLELQKKVTFAPHPDFVNKFSGSPAARPTRVEVDAHGETHVMERSYAKGSPSPETWTYMTDDELVGKFRNNALGVLSESQTDQLIDAFWSLEKVEDVNSVFDLLTVCAPAAAH